MSHVQPFLHMNMKSKLASSNKCGFTLDFYKRGFIPPRNRTMQVIPKWKAHAVRDWQDLLVTCRDRGTEINVATSTLLNYLPIIGITTLTEENASDAWCRIAISQALFGSLCTDTTTGLPMYLTKSDVLRHVGIETEGDLKSFQEFCGSIHYKVQNEDDSLSPFFIANGGKSFLKLLGLT